MVPPSLLGFPERLTPRLRKSIKNPAVLPWPAIVPHRFSFLQEGKEAGWLMFVMPHGCTALCPASPPQPVNPHCSAHSWASTSFQGQPTAHGCLSHELSGPDNPSGSESSPGRCRGLPPGQCQSGCRGSLASVSPICGGTSVGVQSQTSLTINCCLEQGPQVQGWPGSDWSPSCTADCCQRSFHWQIFTDCDCPCFPKKV